MSIQLFVPKFRIDECLAAIRECLEKGWTGLGFKTATMEEEWKTYEGGQNFNVPGNSSFEIETLETLDYVCHFG